MRTRESLPRDIARLFIWYPLRYLFMILPLSISLLIIDFIAWLHYFLSAKKRSSIISRQLSIIQPLKEYDPNHIAKSYFNNHYRNQMFIFLLNKLKRHNCKSLNSMITADDSINILDAPREGGIIIVHPHIFIPQLALYYLYRKGYKAAQIYFLNNENLSFIGKNVQRRIRLNIERRLASRMFPAEFFIRDIIKWLKDGNILFVTGDGAGYGKIFGKSMSFPLFGKPYEFPSDYLRIAERTKSRLIGMSMKEIPHRRSRYIISFTGFPETDSNETAISWYSVQLEEQIKAFPYAWHFLDWERDGDIFIQS